MAGASYAERVKGFIVAEFRPGVTADQLADDYDLVANGVIDSLGLLFTIESKREEILCIIPKFHVCSRVSKPTRKLVVQLREVRCLVSTDQSTTLGYAWGKNIKNDDLTNCRSIGYLHSNIAKYCEHGKPAQLSGVT